MLIDFTRLVQDSSDIAAANSNCVPFHKNFIYHSYGAEPGLAQLVERRTVEEDPMLECRRNPQVSGSNPEAGIFFSKCHPTQGS